MSAIDDAIQRLLINGAGDVAIKLILMIGYIPKHAEYQACYGCDVDTIKQLQSIDESAWISNSEQQACCVEYISQALYRKNIELVKYLVDWYKEDPKRCIYHHDIHLELVLRRAADDRHLEGAKILLEMGVDPEMAIQMLDEYNDPEDEEISNLLKRYGN